MYGSKNSISIQTISHQELEVTDLLSKWQEMALYDYTCRVNTVDETARKSRLENYPMSVANDYRLTRNAVVNGLDY